MAAIQDGLPFKGTVSSIFSVTVSKVERGILSMKAYNYWSSVVKISILVDRNYVNSKLLKLIINL